MISCSGCKRQQPGVDVLCLACIEDLNAWLRQIPDLYDELHAVRLPGSVRMVGPQTGRRSASHPPAPTRLEVVDLLDRGVVVAKLEVWATFTGTVSEMCDNLRHHLLSVTMLSAQDAGDFYRTIRALCRDLGRTVGEPDDDKPIGKCSRPIDGDELCRGQLLRTQDGRAVYCRRCGDKPELKEQGAWVTLEQAARVVGKPIETVRTWYKRGRLGYRAEWVDHAKPHVGWTEPIGPQPPRMAWLPTVSRLANAATTTVQHSSGIVNHGSGAELSLEPNAGLRSRQTFGFNSGSDADVLGRVVSGQNRGNVTPRVDASAGKAVAPDPSQLDRSRAAAVRAGEETPSPVPPHGRVSPGSGTGGDPVSGEMSARVVHPYKTEDESRSVDGDTARSIRVTGSQP